MIVCTVHTVPGNIKRNKNIIQPVGCTLSFRDPATCSRLGIENLSKTDDNAICHRYISAIFPPCLIFMLLSCHHILLTFILPPPSQTQHPLLTFPHSSAILSTPPAPLRKSDPCSRTMSLSFRLVALCAVLSLSKAFYCPRTVHLAIGTYTKISWLPSAAGEGISLVKFTPPLLSTTAKLTTALTGENPSYVASAPPHLYAANAFTAESIQGALTQVTFLSHPPYLFSAPRLAGTGGTSHVATIDTYGARGKSRVILLANYAGSVSSFIRRQGFFSRVQVYQIPKSSAAKNRHPNLTFRQREPHPHMILPYGNGVLVPDLGADRVWQFDVNKASGRLTLRDYVQLQPGDGPRHAALHRSGAVYVVNELSNTLTVIRPGVCGKGIRSVCKRLPLVGNDARFEGATAAAVRVSADGRFVYASVRKAGMKDDGVIVAFKLDARSGNVLHKVGMFNSGGVHPRDFYIVDRVRFGKKCASYLAVVNRDSNNLVMLERNVKSGMVARKASFTMQVKTPASVLRYA